MTGWLIGAITLLLVVLILGRRSSKDFRRKSEEPKFQFLANLGVEAEDIHREEAQEDSEDEEENASSPQETNPDQQHQSRTTLSSLPMLLLLTVCLGCSHSDPPRTAPTAVALPTGEQSNVVRAGRDIFDHTPEMAPKYTGNKLSCSDCHIGAGTEPYAAPMIDLEGLFPMFNKRAGHIISLQQRIQECFARSENGKPPPLDSPDMQALTAYIHWLSRDGVKGKAFSGRGFVKVADLQGSPVRGKQTYATKCASCHGTDGAGVPPVLPPLWGPASFNDGAGMNDPEKMAAFLMHNMPQNHPGTLNQQQAWDISAYIHSMPRPKFDPAYKSY